MKVEILRREPDGKPFRQTFLYDGDKHVSVARMLNVINYADDLYDVDGKRAKRIRWECSCMQKLCGACAMRINGVPSLACSTFLDSLALKDDKLVLEPLTKFPVIADLEVDRSVIFENLREMNLWLEGNALAVPADKLARCYNAEKCLKCGLCLEICPNFTGGRFAGAVSAVEGYSVLCRGGNVKKEVNKRFLSSCSKASSCAEICPMGMETLGMIAELYGGSLR